MADDSYSLGDWGKMLLATVYPQGYTGLRRFQEDRQIQQALPVAQKLQEFNANGWSSDPNFTGDEWTKGLLETNGVNADMGNPHVLKAVTDYANQAQTEKSYAEQLKRIGTPDADAGSLSRFALNPGVTPHLKTLEAAPNVFIPQAEDDTGIRNAAGLLGIDPEKVKGIAPKDLPGLVSLAKEKSALDQQSGLSAFQQEIAKADHGTYGEIGKPGTFEPALTKVVRELQTKPQFAGNPLVAKYADEYLKEQLKRQETMPWQHGLTESLSVGSGDEKATRTDRYDINSFGREIPGSRMSVTSHARPAKITGNMGRLVQAFDKDTRDLVYVSSDEVKANPSRYAPAGQQMKANQQETLIEDIRGTITNTMASLDKMPAFTSAQQAQIALMLKERDPASAMSSFLGSKIGQTLTRDQVEYITDLAVLKENILAMRSLLGGGQSSRDQRAAIEATIPAAIQPNKAYAKVQLQKALRTLDRVGRGVPNASLKPEGGGKAEKQIVERRKGRDGKVLVKYSDGTIGRE